MEQEIWKLSFNSTLVETLEIQAKNSASFMSGSFCQKGKIGAEFKKTMKA